MVYWSYIANIRYIRMKISKNELTSILTQFNPWWRSEKIPDLPLWHRSAFPELMRWIQNPPAPRAILLSGPRQVGKTTLLLQAIQSLLEAGAKPGNILYATFDHPICKLAGLDAVLETWREIEPMHEGPEYLFLDEAQFIKDIGTWVKHRVDFFKNKKIVFTGSATPLIQYSPESGVGRWHTIELSTLSFYEYIQLKKISIPKIAIPSSLEVLSQSTEHEILSLQHSASQLIGHFQEYLIRGGFPQTVLMESITQSQKLLREDIIDKVLKRDMTALFGVRRVLELEQMFIYLCLHDGGQQDIKAISKELGIAKTTVQNFIELLESTHLIYKIPPFGYGKEILRGQNKIYLSDPAIAPAVLIKGKSILEDSHALSQCVETSVVGHLYGYSPLLSYWRNKKSKEVDFVAEIEGRSVPFEVKYQSQNIQTRDVPALLEFVNERPSISKGYVITKSANDLGLLDQNPQIIKIPASLFCYWLGAGEYNKQLRL